jgi:23S rRNA (uridine2552-2'-O)-methyltransferase
MPGKSRSWIQRRKNHYYRSAKKEGYRSRAIFKLQQIDSKFKVIKRGFRVVDVGAAPGGWLQYSAERVGDGGVVLGLDIKEIRTLPYENVKTMVLDVMDGAASDRILLELDGRADVVLSDLSPNISGVWDVDVAKQVVLCDRVLEVAGDVLNTGGSLVIKVFEGRDSHRIVEKLNDSFASVSLYRPPTTRKRSSEFYAVCLGFRREASSTTSRKT